MRSRSAVLPSSLPRDLASAVAFSGGTSRPLTPFSTTSGMPPTGVATTGAPQAIASTRTLGMPSLFPLMATRAGSVTSAARR